MNRDAEKFTRHIETLIFVTSGVIFATPTLADDDLELFGRSLDTHYWP